MRLTLHTDYALRTLIFLAVRSDDIVTIRDISRFYEISKNHMMKVAQKLVHHGFVISERGRNGGLRLAKAEEDILIGDVVAKMEPDFALIACLNQESNCKIDCLCGIKPVIMEAHRAFLKVLEQYSLADCIINKDQLSQLLSTKEPLLS